MDSYPLAPNRITSSGIKFKNTIVTSESGYEQRSSVQSLPIYTFRLIHELLNANEQKMITDFFIAKKGQQTKFYFINHITGVTHECRFSAEKLSIDYVNAYFANIEVEIQTC